MVIFWLTTFDRAQVRGIYAAVRKLGRVNRVVLDVLGMDGVSLDVSGADPRRSQCAAPEGDEEGRASPSGGRWSYPSIGVRLRPDADHVWNVRTKFTYKDNTTQTVNSTKTCKAG
jgi:hypothetical protein